MWRRPTSTRKWGYSKHSVSPFAHVPRSNSKGQRSACLSQFSPSPCGAQRLNSVHQADRRTFYPLSHLFSPPTNPSTATQLQRGQACFPPSVLATSVPSVVRALSAQILLGLSMCRSPALGSLRWPPLQCCPPSLLIFSISL